MSLTPLEELIRTIEHANSVCSEVPNDVTFFRNIEQKLEEYFFSVPPDEVHAELMSVYLILEHILTVLTGDVRYHKESVGLVREVFGSVYKLLEGLVPLVSKAELARENFHLEYADTVKTYLTNVKRINDLLKNVA